jgi:GTP cyclohydrolase I
VFDETAIKAAVTSIIKAIGEDPEREGLVGTPGRVADMYAELFMGLNMDPGKSLPNVRRFRRE